MRHAVLISVILSSFLFAGIIDNVGKDPERSWNDLMDLIKKAPDSPVILSEGPRIASKKKLANYGPLKEAVIKEDFDQFIKDLSNSLDLQVDLSREILIVFPQLKGHMERFEKGEFGETVTLKSLWKVGFRLSAPEGFGKWLVQSFLKDPYLLDWNLVGMIRNFDNSSQVSREIINNCLSYQKEELLFPSLYRLLEIADQSPQSDFVDFTVQLRQYMDLLNKINRLEPSRLTTAELSKIVDLFDRLSLPKEEIRKRLLFVIENAKRAGVRFGGIESKDKQVNNSLKALDASVGKRKLSLTWLILSVFAVLVVLSVDKIRLSLLIAFGMKGAAIKTCKRILLRKPSDLKIRSKLAMLYEQLGDINQAVREYQCIKDLSRMLRSKEESND